MTLIFLKKSSKKGFTLIEMIVSLAIFTIVAVVAIGALLKILDINRKSINLKNAINNISFSLESMSRELRVGRDYNTSNDNSGWIIDFIPSISNIYCPKRYAYKYYPNLKTIKKAKIIGCNPDNIRPPLSFSDSEFQNLVSPEVKITASSLTISNSNNYSKFNISLTGYSGLKEKDKTEFFIQTSVSQLLK